MAKEKESIPQDISFAKVAETSLAVLTKLKKEVRFIYANKKAEEVLGLEESEITERTYKGPAWKITDFPWPVTEMTLHHHERLDGAGYPDEGSN